MDNMPDAIPIAIERLIRERRALLWVCQRYDLADGETLHGYDLPAAEAVLRYRAGVTATDRALAKRYWEAIWLEGARSPLLIASRDVAQTGDEKTRPVVVLSSEWDAKAEVNSDEFLPIFVLPGVLDDLTPADAKYGTLKKRQRENCLGIIL
jgi:hypothetical protein